MPVQAGVYSGSVTGHLNPSRRSGGRLFLYSPTGTNTRRSVAHLATGCRTGFSCWDASYPWRVTLRPHRRHFTFSTAAPARNSNELLITWKSWYPSQHRSLPSSVWVRATVTVLLSLLEVPTAVRGFHVSALAGGVRLHAPSEVFLNRDSVLIKLTLLDMLQIPMTAARAGSLVVHGYCSRLSPSFPDSSGLPT